MFNLFHKKIASEFTTEDMIIPMLKFPDPTPIKITITDKHLNLYIGARDLQFDLASGECVAGGTGLCGTEFSGHKPSSCRPSATT